MTDQEKEKIFKTLCDEAMAKFVGREMDDSLRKDMEDMQRELNEQMKELGIDLHLVIQTQNADQN